MADTATNLVRSILGQGLAMGWGDEAEAWLRSKLGDEEYEKALTEIRSEYGTFSEESPWVSGIGEIAGGAIPAVASFLTPGGQLSAATTTGRMLGPLSRLIGLGKTAGQRTTAQNVGRIATTGGVQGAITGAGSTEGDRTAGAVGGGLFGTAFGTATPLVLKGTGELASRVFDMAGVSPNKAKQWALEKLNLALDDESPRAIASRIRQDIQLGVPPAIANVTPGTVQLAESVVQRGGKPSRELEEKIAAQKAGSRDRVAKQVRRGLQARDYYKEEGRLIEDLRSDADTLYDAAYAVGDINDPVINRVLLEPEFQRFFTKAQGILDKKRLAAELDPQGDPSKFVLRPIYDPQTGQMVATPDVRTLDYIKQGIDAEIGELYKAGKSAEGNALKALREQYIRRLDDLVPEYKAARAEYKGDIETLEALRLGRDEFRNLDPEQVQKFVKDMSKGELNAFRTGVARNLFDTIMDPATDINAAKRIIGSPSTRKSLEAVFETPAQRDFFMTALERELELFKSAGQILAGSPTAKRTAMRETLENRPGVMEAAAETASRGFIGSIAQGVLSLLRKGVPDEYYQELANLLKSGSPKEVAAVVKMLEEAAQKRGFREGTIGGTQAGIVGGTIGLAPPAPESAEARRSREERQMLYR
jgi:hypothetical protein